MICPECGSKSYTIEGELSDGPPNVLGTPTRVYSGRRFYTCGDCKCMYELLDDNRFGKCYRPGRCCHNV